MGISSLGVGSSILTQDVIDQLKAADEAQFISPKDKRINTEKSKNDALKIVDALMENVYESLKGLTEYGVFESRVTNVSGESVEVSAANSSDIQDFSIEVSNIATKQIEQSGSFTTKDAAIANGTGTGKLDLTVGAETFNIEYDQDTSLEDLKELINTEAGGSVEATIVQVTSNDFRLILSAKETGTGQAISIVESSATGDLTLKDQLKADPDGVDPDDPLNLIDGMNNVQNAVDANFRFNGLDITRTSNSVDDLVSGLTVTLKEAGTSNVSVKQDRENITSKIENFIEKYNSAMYQLDEDTKSSEKASERGIFSSESTIKNMKRAMENIFNTIGEGVARIDQYGIEFDDDGRLSLDTTVLNSKLDKDPESVKAYFTGGTFTKEDGTTVEMTGVFDELEEGVARYSKYNAVLDQLSTSITDKIENIEEQKSLANQRLEARYATMAKRFAAYDQMISKINSASSMFLQMANAQIAAQES